MESEQPKRQDNELTVLMKVGKLLDGIEVAAQRRIAFYFADRLGIVVKVPNGNGETHG